MSNTLESVIDTRRLRFNDLLQVDELGDDGAVLRTTAWESLSSEKENEISFRFPNESRTSLAVKYAFNDRNQLTLQIVKQPGVAKASDIWTLPGKIFADDATDLEYVLIDDRGSLTTRKIEIYAELDFADGNSELRVVFPDKSETAITGSRQNRSLTAAAYHSGGDLTRDLLLFSAVTRNTVDGTITNLPASIKFYGRWDLHENALVFVTKYETGPDSKPAGYIALAGKIKGTNVGLILEQNGSAALQINGRYQWNQNRLNWDLNLGYSKAAGIEAHLAAGAEIVGKNGVLTIDGEASLKKNDEGVPVTSLSLNIKYTTKSGSLVFNLQNSAEGYDIQFSGDFKITNGNVNFTLTVAGKNGKPTATGSVSFGRYTEDSSLQIALEAVLGPNGIELKLNLEFEFSWGPKGAVAELP